MPPLEFPYIVFGIITSYGNPLDATTVYIQDTTLSSTILTTTTNSSGQYLFDISSIADEGDTITVWIIHNGRTASESFTLSLLGPGEEVNLDESAFGFTSAKSTYSFTSSMPCGELTIDYNDIRDLQMFNMWGNTSTIYDKGLKSKNITITGVENNDVYTKMAGIDSVLDAGDVITMFGLKDTYLNTTWVIESFTYDFIAYNMMRWSLTLEKYY